jgi:hypothetical protein
MKYIAIFDIPDDRVIGCVIAKIAPKGKEVYTDEDFENAYAQTEPLSEEKTEIFERFNTVDRVISDLGLSCACDMPSFWCNKGKDYKVIPTKYHNGYMQALADVEKEIRLRFGFAERDNLIPIPFDGFFKAAEGE